MPDIPLSTKPLFTAVIRCAVPYTGLILSTRETPEMRRKLYHIGINDAGGKFICGYDIMTGSWGPKMPLPAEIIIVGEQNDESFEVWIPISFVEKVKADWWVTSDTSITIEANELGCCPCPVEGIEFRIWEDGEWSKWIEYEGSFSFDKDCAHYLHIRAWDCLGNMNEDRYTRNIDTHIVKNGGIQQIKVTLCCVKFAKEISKSIVIKFLSLMDQGILLREKRY